MAKYGPRRPPIVTRLAPRVRLVVAGIGLATLGIAVLEVTPYSLPQPVLLGWTITVAALTGLFFLVATFDWRFQCAVSAVNAERFTKAKTMDWKAKWFGVGLPVGDPILFLIAAPLLLISLFGVGAQIGLAAIAAAFLVILEMIALMTRGYPYDRLMGWNS